MTLKFKAIVFDLKHSHQLKTSILIDSQKSLNDLQDLFKKAQNPDLYKETKQSISGVGKFVGTGMYKTPGIQGKHISASLEFNAEEALAVNATTGTLQNTPQTASAELLFEGGEVQKITGPYLINPQEIQQYDITFKPNSPYQQMLGVSGDIMPNSLVESGLNREVGILKKNISKDMTSTKIPPKKSVIEHYAGQNKIDSEELLEASMHAQEKYDELTALFNNANVKGEAWGILKLSFLGIIDLDTHLANLKMASITKASDLVDMKVGPSQLKMEEYFNYLKVTLHL
jgi:hypothetical protein